MTKQSKGEPAFGARSDIGKDHLYLVDGGHIFTTPWINTPETRRRSICILLTAQGAPFELRFRGKVTQQQAVVTAPLVKRGVRGDNVRFMSFVVNPLSPQFQLLNTIPQPGLLSLPRNIFDRFNPALEAAYRGELGESEAIALQSGVVAVTAEYLPPARPVDARVDHVREQLQRNPNTRVRDLAVSVKLSESRLSHLFKEAMSMGIRSYAFWVKMHAALEMVHLQDARFTSAAHAAGFQDLSHFSREYARAFGAPPSYFRDPERVQVFEYRRMHFAQHIVPETGAWKRSISSALSAEARCR